MGKIILVTGGARSGKSSFAEEAASRLGDNVLYVATAKAFDDEMRDRIARHRASRPSGWKTVEGHSGMRGLLSEEIEGRQAVLLDCITIMVTNLMLDNEPEWDNVSRARMAEIEKRIQSEILELADFALEAEQTFILVTNEVGMGLVPAYAMGRDFRDIAGRVNQYLASKAQEVYLCVSGIPVKIKG